MCRHDSEADLIRQAVAGDRVALSQLLLIHHDGLKHHISGMITTNLQGLISADDILHQTFVRAAQSVHSFQPRHDSAFGGWLQTIASNLVKDAAKRRRRERRASPGQGRKPAVGDDSSMAAVVDRIAAGITTPGRRVQRRESIRQMRAALATLPEDQREVINRHYLQGETYEQIAAATGRTKGAIRGLCYRARKNLRAIMGGSSLYFSG
jgi:RNA polymerase sigma-70 factor (ECF subfamily)